MMKKRKLEPHEQALVLSSITFYDKPPGLKITVVYRIISDPF